MEIEYPCLFFSADPNQGDQALQQTANELDATLTPKVNGGHEFSYQGKAILQGEAAEHRYEYLASKQHRSPEYLYFFLFGLLIVAFLEMVVLDLFLVEYVAIKTADHKIEQPIESDQPKGQLIVNWAGVSLLPISLLFLWLRNRERRIRPTRLAQIRAELKAQEDQDKLLNDFVNSRFVIRVNPHGPGGVVQFELDEPDLMLPFLVEKIMTHLPAKAEPTVNKSLRQLLDGPVLIRFAGKPIDFERLNRL